MKIKDVLELTKAGFTPKDIIEIIRSEKEVPQVSETTPNKTILEDSTHDQTTVEDKNNVEDQTVEDQTPKQETIEDEKLENEPDGNLYKKLYEDALKDLQKAQSVNIARNIDTEPVKDDNDLLNDFVRSFM